MAKIQDLPASPLRTAEMVWSCPVFGRYKITKSLLDQMAEQIEAFMNVRGHKDMRAVVQCTGKQFQRQDLLRFITRELTARGVNFTQNENQDAFWLITIDELFYFGIPMVEADEWMPKSPPRTEREASLPREIAASMVYLIAPKAGELLWDPVCGSGTILSEAAAREPELLLFGSDVDRKATEIAKKNVPLASISNGDSSKSKLENINVVIGNLPFGKKYGSKDTNQELYSAILRSAHRVGAERGAFLTSDIDSFRNALISVKTWRLRQAIDTQVRGTRATIYIISR